MNAPRLCKAGRVGLAALAACIACAACLARGQSPEADSSAARRTYAFDPRADALLHELFPRKVAVSGLTKAFQQRGRPPRFENLDAVFEHYSQAMNVDRESPQVFELDDNPLESAWLGAGREPGWQRPLLRRATHIEALAGAIARSKLRLGSPLEKALFQRDVLQMCTILQRAGEAEETAELRQAGRRALKTLVSLWQRLWLTDREHQALVRLRPKLAAPKRFTPTSRVNLADDYLPTRVLAGDKGWYGMPFGDKASQHFRAYGGRSFIRIYVKPRGWTQEQFFRYWDRVADQFGVTVTRDGRVPALPAGTETLLLRTFGVFLDDGSYVDSGFPEEVLLRLFKHSDTRLDMGTSDYRGTLAYRYVLRRRDLLAGAASLGLRRIRDDDPQFFGFLADVPDYHRANSAALTPMRTNCIACHSEAFYGASTVFSLAHKRRGRPGQDRVEGGLLEPTRADGRFRLRSPEIVALQPYLERSAK